ncbi:MAG: DUF2807 domain-containing protein [Negativicutes bacterium]|jgi:hypothetical protein
MKKIFKNKAALLLAMAVVICLTLGNGCATVSASTVTKEINLNGFDIVSIGGSWDVKIVQGAQYKITVTAPSEYIDSVCTLDGRKLTVQQLQSNWSWLRFWEWSFDGRNKIQITAPDMKKISFSGSTDGSVSGFKSADLQVNSSGASDLNVTNCVLQKMSIYCSGSSDVVIGQSVLNNLFVDCAGSSKIAASGCSVERLSLDVAGSSRFTFTDGKVKDLYISLAGSANVVIDKMVGGKMTGSMSGSCNLTYSGEISGYGVETSGSSKVRMK